MTNAVKNTKVERLDYLVNELQKMDKDSISYQLTYAEIFNSVYNDGVKYVEFKASQMRGAVRIDMGDMYALITEALMYEVKIFDITKHNNFKKLFKEKLKQLVINYQKKMNNRYNASLTMSDDEDAKIQADNNMADKSIYGATVDTYTEDKEPTLYDLLDEYVTINPKARIFYYFELPVESRTAHILKILGATEYDGKTRKSVYDLKKKFERFLLDNNYRIQ